jgi:integrase
METTPPSRNPFADPALPSLADLIPRIKADETLPLRTRQNWPWALRAVSHAVGKDPAEVPAHPEFLRKVLAQAAPASIGLTKPAWNNARSLLGKALKWAGFASVPGHYQALLSKSWQELRDTLPSATALRGQPTRLFHYASAQGIEPTDMNDAVLDQFYRALVAESIVRNPYEVYRGSAKSWNNAVERVPGWPQQRLTVPSRARVFSLPWSAFPQTLGTAVEAYLHRATGLDLSDDHFTRAQRPATIDTRRKQLRLFATAIVKTGIAPENLVDLQTILQPEVARCGLKFLLDRNNGASSVQISNLAAFLPTLANRLDMPEDVIGILRRMKGKLKVTQRGMTARNREALRAFDDPAAVKALLGLPQRIVREVEASGRRGYREAKLIQTALAIELLLNAPVRIENLASIEPARHLLEVGTRTSRAVHLCFPAAEVKNRHDLEFPLMASSIALLDIYYSQWRPLLTTGLSPFLFPGKTPQSSKGNGALSAQIRKLVHNYARLDMPAHRFRHAAAKIFLDRNPGQYEIIRQLLGHKDIQTTITFYAGSESASAARHYARTILGIRHGGIGLEAPHG